MERITKEGWVFTLDRVISWPKFSKLGFSRNQVPKEGRVFTLDTGFSRPRFSWDVEELLVPVLVVWVGALWIYANKPWLRPGSERHCPEFLEKRAVEVEEFWKGHHVPGMDPQPDQIWAQEQPPPVRQHLERRQLEEAKQLLDNGLEGETKARHEHPLVETDIPKPKLPEDALIQSKKMKLHERGNIVVVAKEGFIRLRVHGA